MTRDPPGLHSQIQDAQASIRKRARRGNER